MTCRYEKDGLKEKKIEKISKIWIRKIFSIRSKSIPTTIRREPSQEDTTQPTHWELVAWERVTPNRTNKGRNHKVMIIARHRMDFYLDIGMKIFIEKSLISCYHWGEIHMHDVLKELGKTIVLEKSRKEPIKRSRLWDYKGLQKVMIKKIRKPRRVFRNNVDYGCSIKKYMNHLNFLVLRNVNFSVILDHLSNKLRYMFWGKYAFMCLSLEYLPNLRILYVSYSKNLIEMPDLRGVPHLKRLHLEGWLNSLILKNCKNLHLELNIIFGLNSLVVLDLSGCSKLFNNHPLQLEADENRSLLVSYLSCFPCLYHLLQIPDAIENLHSLGGNKFVTLPNAIKQLFKLQNLNLSPIKQNVVSSIKMDLFPVTDNQNCICYFVAHDDPKNNYSNSWVPDYYHHITFGVQNVFCPVLTYVPIQFKRDLVTVGFEHLLIIFFTQEYLINQQRGCASGMHDLDTMEFGSINSFNQGLYLEGKNCGYLWLFEEDHQQFKSNMMFTGNSSSREHKLLTSN
ncbi:putative WRKY transcription factor 19 [Glycine soja]